MSLRFACTCGQQLAVREELVGRKVRCTACSEIITVPNEAGATASAAPRPASSSRAIKSSREQEPDDRPSRAAKRRDEDEDENEQQERDDRELDQDDEDMRPRRKRKKKAGKNNKVLLIAVLAGVLLLGGGLLGWWLLSKKSGSASADFDMVPRDAVAFFTVRVGDILRTDAGKRAFEEARKNDKNGDLAKMEKATGLTLNDIERVTVVLTNFDQGEAYFLVRTAKPINQKGFLDEVKNGEERKHSGKSYHAFRAGDGAVHFADNNLIVGGNEQGVKKFLEQPSKPKSGALDEYIVLASQEKNHVAGALLVPTNKINELRQGLGGPLGAMGVNALFDTKAVYTTMSVGNTIDSEVGFEMPSKDKAKAAVDEILKLKGLAGMAAMNMPQQLQAQFNQSVTQIDPKQDGNKVKLTFSQDSNQLITQLLQAIATQSQSRPPVIQPNIPRQPRLPMPPRRN